MHPSAPRASAAAMPRSTSSWAGITASPPGLSAGVEQPHAAHENRWAAVRHRRHLTRLALATVEGATEHPGGLATHGLHGAPEVGRRGLIRHVLHLPGQLPALNAVEALPGELEVVALHVDRPALGAHDVDATVDAGDEVLGARAVGPG